jgi:hypothetical protein
MRAYSVLVGTTQGEDLLQVISNGLHAGGSTALLIYAQALHTVRT